MTLTAKGLFPLTRIDDTVAGLVENLSVFVTPQMFAPEGATVGDGTARALSTIYGSLGDAQADFSFITALTQTIDYACIKAMSNEALGPDQTASSITYTDQPTSGSTAALINDTTKTWTVNEHVGKTLFFRYANGFIGTAVIASNTVTSLSLSPSLPYDNFMLGTSACGYITTGVPGSIYNCVAYGIGAPGEHGDGAALLNKPMVIPAGEYMLGNDTWLIRNASGVRIIGAGRRATKIKSNSWAFATDGLWYSKIEGIEFATLTSTAGHGAVDIDGNVPGHPYSTRSVQQNTFQDVGFDGGLSTYGLAVNRLGGSSAQGENIFINCNWQRATVTYYQNGFNALANLILRGDMQDFTTGVYIVAGDIHVVSTSMESTRGYAQITDTSFVAQGGYDFDCSASGVNEPITIEGVRSESLRFYRGSAAQKPVLIGNQTSYGVDAGWTAVTSGYYTLGKSIIKTSATLGKKLYVVTTAGTSGATEPTWPDSGTVADGTVVWTMTDFYVVDVSTSGSLVLIGNQLTNDGGRIRGGDWGNQFAVTVNTATTYSVKDYNTPHRVIFADTTTGNQTITIPISLTLSSTVPDGSTITIKKVTTDANTVTLAYTGGNGGEAAVIPGGSTGYVTIQYSQNAGVSSKWWIISKSW